MSDNTNTNTNTNTATGYLFDITETNFGEIVTIHNRLQHLEDQYLASRHMLLYVETRLGQIKDNIIQVCSVIYNY
jgi:hypothetical protein